MDVRKWSVLPTMLGVCVVLAGCGSGSASSSPTVSRYTASEAAVCKAFNAASGPLAVSDSIETSFAKLAAAARNADVRREGRALLRYHEPSEAMASKSFFSIGAACVARGFTPKDWAELA